MMWIDDSGKLQSDGGYKFATIIIYTATMICFLIAFSK